MQLLEKFCLTAQRLAQELQGFLALSAQEEATPRKRRSGSLKRWLLKDHSPSV